MDKANNDKKINWVISYFKEVISWTIFAVFAVIGVLLVYYFISVRLYMAKGEKYEPKFSIYSIASGSMVPTLNVRDVIINLKVDNIDDVKINDVITFISTWEVNSGMTVTHRVVGIKKADDGQTCLITRGDANTSEDKTCVKKENLIGVTKAVIPGLGKLQTFLLSKAGWFLLIVIPVLYMIFKNVLKIIKLAESGKENKYSDEPKLNEAYKDLKKIKKSDKK